MSIEDIRPDILEVYLSDIAKQTKAIRNRGRKWNVLYGSPAMKRFSLMGLTDAGRTGRHR